MIESSQEQGWPSWKGIALLGGEEEGAALMSVMEGKNKGRN